MARVQYGSIITDIAGSLGGLTFQRNGSGKIVRNRPIQPRQGSAGQNSVRQAFNDVTYNWSTLSLANKQAWAAYALAHPVTTYWGTTKQLNGYQMHNQINSYRKLCGLALTASPATYVSPYIPPLQSLTFNASSMVWQLIPTAGTFPSYFLLFTSPPISLSTANARGQVRLTKVSQVISATSISFLAEYLATHNLAALPASNGVNYYCHVYLAAVNSSCFISGAFNKQVVQLP
jgi:hypothetical protein